MKNDENGFKRSIYNYKFNYSNILSIASYYDIMMQMKGK